MARVLLQEGESYTVVNDNTQVVGGTGSESIRIFDEPPFEAKGITFDQNIEHITLSQASSDYLYQQTGNLLEIFDQGGNLLMTIPVGTDESLTLEFSDGAKTTKFETSGIKAGEISVGGKLVPDQEGGAALQEPLSEPDRIVTIGKDGKDDSGNDATEDASDGNVMFVMLDALNDNYTYVIEGFGEGDVLDFAEGFEVPSVFNTDFADGDIEIQAADASSNKATLQLTGIALEDGSVFIVDAMTFNNTFGVGSLI